jgi:uncharacterized glyoxalase superfamily protein PhnB
MGTVEQLFLLVADLERSRTFYEEAIGLTPDRVGETSVTYETGGCQLKLQADFDPGVLEGFNLPEPPAADRGSGAISVLSVDEPLSDRYEQVVEVTGTAAGEPLTEPRAVPWGDRMFLTADPDGYVWEVRAESDG